jgi:hypothetical protein
MFNRAYPFFLETPAQKSHAAENIMRIGEYFLITGHFCAQLCFPNSLKTETIGDYKVHNCNGNY